MPKKCTICEAEAQFVVKGTSDFYCPPCAEDNFGDVTLLIAIEEQAKALKEATDSDDQF
ncbi:MAG TPA: hypothetical protein VJK52_05450 [Candidatus Nanoarchaeia archaeon]|nr:hypothetical protein [Candidatus Nanoarchaeia archaeon]